ncbi:hypothetical protein LTR17_011752 [Elasticomyces elasticus]|nr:hypothetical protein LTR17_011752 [Elasticomyces elasticus]
MQELDLLILGAGWTSTFLIPLLRSHHLSFAATTRDGREVAGSKTIAWSFNPENQTATLVQSYSAAKGKQANFIQLGSSGIWQIPQETHWVSRRSPYNKSSPRAIAEDELLKLDGCVLNLAGLWGGARDPKTWVDRVAKTKEDVKNKKSLHMVHGVDVARAIVAVMNDWDKAKGQRWMVTDGFVYDWWSLMVGWADAKNEETRKNTMIGQPVASEGTGEPIDQAKWVFELMREEKIWALPRSMEVLGRCYFGREFWDVFGLVPLKARI